MTVPFEHLGPGQVGRLAYQVIGKAGPIPNPANIRYLPVGSVAAGAGVNAGLAGTAVALGALNLAAGVGTLVLAAATYVQVRKLNAKVDALLAWTRTADVKLDEIIERARRIDVRVAENNLRHAVQHILQTGTSPEDVDLVQLARIADEIDAFMETDGGMKPGGNLGIRLTADVHDMLHGIWSLFFHLRRLVLQDHNRRVGGDPTRIIPVDPVRDYVEPSWADWDLARKLGLPSFRPWIDDAVAAIDNKFAVDKRLSRLPILEALVVVVAINHKPVVSKREYTEAPLREHHERLGTKLLDPVVLNATKASEEVSRLLEEKEASEEAAAKLASYLPWWIHRTDAGLLWRVRAEAKAIREGYAKLPGLRIPRLLPASPDPLELNVDVRIDENAIEAAAGDLQMGGPDGAPPGSTP
ncbi:MAG: hypothetical protein QME96_11010 [Myxococcota bacterium]|nr:hypothetical protein [Myxococcota bacterium]